MHQLTLSRRFEMSLEALFAAWASADAVRSWFCPGNMSVPEAEVDFRVGGRYRIVMEDGDDGSHHCVTGTYTTIVANERICFTWRWEGSEVETQVDIRFAAAADGGSSLQLRHSQFPDQGLCDEHEKGWNGCLDKLIA